MDASQIFKEKRCLVRLTQKLLEQDTRPVGRQDFPQLENMLSVYDFLDRSKDVLSKLKEVLKDGGVREGSDLMLRSMSRTLKDVSDVVAFVNTEDFLDEVDKLIFAINEVEPKDDDNE